MKGLIFLFAVTLAGCIPEGGEPDPIVLTEERVEDPFAGLVDIEVSMRPAYALVVGITREFQARGWYSDMSTRQLDEHVEWTSSHPDVLSFDDPEKPGIGMVHQEPTEPITVTANLGDVVGELVVEPR